MQVFPDTIALGSIVLATFVLWGAVSTPKLLRAAQFSVALGALIFALAAFYFFTQNSTSWACFITSIALSNIAVVIHRIRGPLTHRCSGSASPTTELSR